MGKKTEYHEDGSHTDRWDDYRNTSATYNSDGTLRETSRDEHGASILGDPDVRVTRDGNGIPINYQELKR